MMRVIDRKAEPRRGENPPRPRLPPEAEGARRGATPRATHGSLTARVRARPSLGGAEGTAGGSRTAHVLRNVISSAWKGGVTRTSLVSHAPVLAPRLTARPQAPATDSPPPRASSTRPAPSKPRAPPSLTATELAARAGERDKRGHRQRYGSILTLLPISAGGRGGGGGLPRPRGPGVEPHRVPPTGIVWCRPLLQYHVQCRSFAEGVGVMQRPSGQ
jgi:hypothetical protein